MGRRPGLSIDDRNIALGLLEAMCVFPTSHVRTIYRLQSRFRHTGSVKDLPRSGRPRKTTPRIDINVNPLNSMIRRLCDETSARLINVNLFFVRNDGRPLFHLFHCDGIHLNVAGSNMLVKIIHHDVRIIRGASAQHNRRPDFDKRTGQSQTCFISERTTGSVVTLRPIVTRGDINDLRSDIIDSTKKTVWEADSYHAVPEAVRGIRIMTEGLISLTDVNARVMMTFKEHKSSRIRKCV